MNRYSAACWTAVLTGVQGQLGRVPEMFAHRGGRRGGALLLTPDTVHNRSKTPFTQVRLWVVSVVCGGPNSGYRFSIAQHDIKVFRESFMFSSIFFPNLK